MIIYISDISDYICVYVYTYFINKKKKKEEGGTRFFLEPKFWYLAYGGGGHIRQQILGYEPTMTGRYRLAVKHGNGKCPIPPFLNDYTLK